MDLPVFKIFDTDFIVDVYKGELRKKENEDIRLGFEEMADRKTAYSFGFHKELRIILPSAYIDRKRVVQVDVPQMTALDPDGMSKRYNVPVKKLLGRSDIEVLSQLRPVKMRLAGKLPSVDIAGDIFYVDLRPHELREHIPFGKPYLPAILRFDQMEMSPDELKYSFFYHKASKEIFDIPQDVKFLPKGIVSVEIPREWELDPIGLARIAGQDPLKFIRHHSGLDPIRAKVIPLSETDLGKRIMRAKKTAVTPPQKKSKRKGRRL